MVRVLPLAAVRFESYRISLKAWQLASSRDSLYADNQKEKTLFPDIPALLETITDWAKTRKDVRGLALVGSHARNQATADSDLDLLVLAENPEDFRDMDSLSGIDWSRTGVHPARYTDEVYGVVWSRRVWLDPEHELDVAFAPVSWANRSPLDIGTYQVIADGFRVLYDPDGSLQRVSAALDES